MELIITENEKDPTICLNMIVKNESHIIKNTLEKLCSKINFSYWVICDTGSTDNTQEIIKDFFANKNIPGELYQDQWVNFAHNRTLALEYAYNKTDLLLVFDADDEIVGNIQMPRVYATIYDEYHLKFGSSIGTSYTRVLLINNKKRFIYQSVIHEYISCLETGPNSNTVIEGDYYVVSGRSGNRSKDPDKYLKDAKILEAAHAEALAKNDPLLRRYAFYCANSYKDHGLFEEAIKWYKITLSQDNWEQEKYVSCLYIYECYQKLNNNIEQGFFYLVKAFKYDTERVESLYPLLVHYCCEGLSRVAYNYYLIIKDYYENHYLNTKIDKKLFVVIDKYNFFVPYYMILIADKVQDFDCVVKMFEIIFIKKMPIYDIWYIRNLLYNLQFFVHRVKPKNKDRFISLTNEYLKFLHKLGISLNTIDCLKDYDNRFGIDVSYIFIKPTINKNISFSKEECVSSKNILFYTGFSDVEWNYSYLKNNALGGSEKAVAYLCHHFPKEYNIYVSGSVKNETVDNVRYIHLNQLTNIIKTIPFHTVIVSRYISFYEMFKECSYYQSFIWAHDTQLLPYGCDLNEKQILTKWGNYINGCICLTEWHKKSFIEKYPDLTNKIKLINNGLDLHTFTKINTDIKIKNKFIYSSRPERGLNVLLQLWPQILHALPDAELVISNYGVNPDAALMDIIQKYDSIKYLGKLNAEQLYAEMSTAEYWLYPTHWPETSCITALEMLMSEVICLYYPLAGLPYTIDKYGIQVTSGNEIDTIVSLTDEQKDELRKNGKKYAETCSWSNRSKIWCNTLSITNINPSNIKNIAIFNSFPFHYEMFGYIIEYCHLHNHNLTIFTSLDKTIGWLDYYKNHFQNYHFEITNILKYKEIQETFDITFITTDDDYAFLNEWVNDKCVVVDHMSIIRRPEYKHRIGTRPFINNYRDWIIPCYKVFEKSDKTNLLDPDIHIALIGGDNNYNYDLINKMYSDKQIHLHVISRNALFFDKNVIKELTNITIYNNIETTHLFHILKNCDYILTDFTYKMSHINGTSMSGNIPLAFSTLTPLIISNQNNAVYKFKNVIEFDMETSDKIYIDKNIIDVDALSNERTQLISMFSSYIEKTFFETNKSNKIPKKIYQTWKTKQLTPEFQAIVDTWKTNNPEYEYYLFDDDDCIQFIANNFNKEVLETYNSIIPGAFKADLWRYCYLYIHGGVYIDIDTICLGKLSDFIKDELLVVPIDLNINHSEGYHNLFNAFIAIVPGSKIMLDCINKIVKNVKYNSIPSGLEFSGPGLLGRVVNTYLGLNEETSFVGKEGHFKCNNGSGFHFLKFEKTLEYVKDINNNILFQNKNGNNEIIQLYNNECKKINNISWVNNKEIIKIQKKMMYENFFDRRQNTFVKSFELIMKHINTQEIYNIVEFGTSRSYVNGDIKGCLDPNPIYWHPDNPEKWDWGAGVFTKVFSDNLIHNKCNFNLYTVDPDENAIKIVNTMIDDSIKNKVIIIKDYSTNFLQNIKFKIDFLYMDHMESSEEACKQHYIDAKYIVENDLMNSNSIILIDDCKTNSHNKSKYSIPYLLDNGFKLILNEYQCLLTKI